MTRAVFMGTPEFAVASLEALCGMEGIEVVDQIANVRTGANDRPLEPQVMKKVTVDTFGVDYPEPKHYN